MIEEVNPQPRNPSKYKDPFPFLTNTKNVVIQRKFDLLIQSNISISNNGKIAICQQNACVIMDLVNIRENRFRVIPILEGDSYHWVFAWNSGFLIVGDLRTQFINSAYQLEDMNMVIKQHRYFPPTEDFYVIITDTASKSIRNLKQPPSQLDLVFLQKSQKLRGITSLHNHQLAIENNQKNVQSHLFTYNLITKQKQLMPVPEQYLCLLKVNEDVLIYMEHGETMNLLKIKDIKTNQVTEVEKFSRPSSFSFTSVSSDYPLVSMTDGKSVQLINYEEKKIVKIEELFPNSMKTMDCQVRSGNLKYYVSLKNKDNHLYLNCSSFFNEKKAKIHLFQKADLMKLYGKGLLETILLKI